MRNTSRVPPAEKYSRKKINKRSMNRNHMIVGGAVASMTLLLAFSGIRKLYSNTALAPKNAAKTETTSTTTVESVPSSQFPTPKSFTAGTNLPLGSSFESSIRVKKDIKSQRIKHAKPPCEQTETEYVNYRKLQEDNVHLWEKVQESALKPSPLTPDGRDLMKWTEQDVCKAMEGTHLVATSETIPLLSKAREAILTYKGSDKWLQQLREVYKKMGDKDEDYLHRLMAKRPLAYFNPQNTWLIRDGKTEGEGVKNTWKPLICKSISTPMRQ